MAQNDEQEKIKHLAETKKPEIGHLSYSDLSIKYIDDPVSLNTPPSCMSPAATQKSAASSQTQESAKFEIPTLTSEPVQIKPIKKDEEHVSTSSMNKEPSVESDDSELFNQPSVALSSLCGTLEASRNSPVTTTEKEKKKKRKHPLNYRGSGSNVKRSLTLDGMLRF